MCILETRVQSTHVAFSFWRFRFHLRKKTLSICAVTNSFIYYVTMRRLLNLTFYFPSWESVLLSPDLYFLKKEVNKLSSLGFWKKERNHVYMCGLYISGCFPDGSVVKNPPASKRCRFRSRSLGWDDPLEKGMAIHLSILAWRIPRTEEFDGLQSIVTKNRTWLKRLSMHVYLRTSKYILHIYICSFSH